jgi:hypothetical protein
MNITTVGKGMQYKNKQKIQKQTNLLENKAEEEEGEKCNIS